MTINELIKYISSYCDDYYPTLAEGNIILNEYQGDTDITSLARTLDCDEESARLLLESGRIEIDNYTCENPENEQHTLYLRTVHVIGTPIIFL